MKNKSLNSIILVLTVFSLATSCQKSPDAKPRVEKPTQGNGSGKPESANSTEIDFSKDLGFFKADHTELPEKVRLAADSVFELRVLSASTDNSIKVLNLKTESAEIEKIKNMEATGDDLIEKKVIVAQIERCEKDETLIEQCPLSIEIRKSTGFLLNSGKELWATAHSIERFLSMRTKYEGHTLEKQLVDKIPLRVFIFNRNGEMVFNPFVETMTLKQLPKKTKAAERNQKFYAEDSDYVVLDLSKSIGQPLKKHTTPPKSNDSVFVVGFPACTGCDASQYSESDQLDFTDRKPKENSSGFGIFISSGRWANSENAIKQLEMTAEAASIYNLNQMVFYSADSQSGMSGSPVVNSQGEVLAIHAGGKSMKKGDVHYRVSRGVAPDKW